MDTIENIRKRPGMYIGSTGPGRTGFQGVFHVLRGLIDNAIVSCLGRTNGTIRVDLQLDGSVRMSCNALLYPFCSAKDLPTCLQDAFSYPDEERMWGRWQGNSMRSVFAWNGFELCIVNALSSSLLVEIQQGRQHWLQAFHNQQPVKSDMTTLDETETTTSITFFLDEIMLDGVHIEWATVFQYLDQSSYLVPDLDFYLSDRRQSPVRVAHFPRTRDIVQYVVDLTRRQQPFTHPISIMDEIEQTGIHIALRYSRGSTTILSFVNNLPTVEHGSHVDGFLGALQRTLSELSMRKSTSKGRMFPLRRIKASLTAVVSVWTLTPMFGGATKDRLSSPEIQQLAFDATSKALRSYFDEYPDDAQQILARLLP